MSSEPFVALHDIAFAYDSAQSPLFSGLSVHFPAGFTGVVGANGSGKTTLLQLIAGALTPVAGTIVGAQNAVYCEQRTDTPPSHFTEFLDDWSSDAAELKSRLEVVDDGLERWETMSHGERKRAQIAVALWRKPSLLVIDEPTNHIDSYARGLLLSSLKRFRGVAVIVSHDRELLDELCAQCLWLTPPEVQVFQGNFTQANQLRQQINNDALREREKAAREYQKVQRDVVRQRDKASQEHNKRSKRGLAAKDHDAKEKIDRARVSDSKAGQSLRSLEGKSNRSKTRLEAAHVEKEYNTGIWLTGSRSRRDSLLFLESGEIPLGADRVLKFPRLVVKPEDRIALVGANGSGKSTLIQHILGNTNVPPEKLIAIPQEVAASAATNVLDEARVLRNEQLGFVMNVVSRLGSRPQRLLESRQPSPGEIRKLMLALGMSQAPHLIVMDEPTNHLDLPSIEALEAALKDCPCGLLLVSHDQRFLDQLDVARWQIVVDDKRNSELLLT